MTAEVYPNENKARILLCTTHHEYMIWWDRHIEEVEETSKTCLATGLHQWKYIKLLSRTLHEELKYTWWVIRRITAWAGKVPDKNLTPIELGKVNKEAEEIMSENIFWEGSLENQMKNI